MGKQLVCDSCNAQVERAHSYCLTTTNVVLSEAFWRRQFRVMTEMMRAIGQDERTQAAAFDVLIRRHAGSTTAWLICEDCSEYFAVDRAAARQHALRGSVPEDSGAVDDIGGFAQFAAAAWEFVFGRWPTSVQQPTVGDTCDFCAKKIYRGEYTGHIRVEVTEQYLASGALESPPLCPPRDVLDCWVQCVVCMSRMVARVDRARGGR